MKKAERERLFSEARRKDSLTNVWDFQSVLSNLEGYLMNENFLNFSVVFDDDKTREEHSKKYWNHITNKLFGEGLTLSSERKDEVTIIKVNGIVARENIPLYLDSLFGNKPIHFSQAFSLYLNGEIVAQTPYPREYSKYFRSEEPYFFNVVRRPYEGRTTYGIQIGVEQRDSVKKLLLDLFCLGKECYFGIGAKKLLYEGSKGRELAFEKMVSRKEDHLRWRIDGEEIGVISSQEMFNAVLNTLISKGGICFYPKVSQKVNGIEVLTKLVLEMDPMGESIENAGIAFEYLIEVLDRLRLPYLALHSGSKSCRAEIFLDGRSIMEKSTDLLKEFPFIGKVATKSLKDEKERYKAIYKTLRMAIFIYLYNLMRHRELGKVVNVTMNKFSIGRYVLFDLPSTVSIGEGSPKSLVEIEKLRKYHNDYRELRLDAYYGFTLCTPIERYEIPKNQDDIYRITNFISAAERIERNHMSYIEQMNKRIGGEELRKVFEKIPMKQFDILSVKGERKFKKMYPLT